MKRVRQSQFEVIKRFMSEFNLNQMSVFVLLSEYKGLLNLSRMHKKAPKSNRPSDVDMYAVSNIDLDEKLSKILKWDY